MPNEIDKALGRNLQRARRIADMTQEALAVATQISRSSIANIELGRQRIHVDTLYRLAAALGVDPKMLLPVPETVQVDEQELDKYEGATRAFVRRVARQEGT